MGGIIPLENIKIREVTDRSKSHCFELFCEGNEVIKACKTDSEGKVVEGKHTCTGCPPPPWRRRTSGSSVFTLYYRRSISHDPCYDMMAVRKKKVQGSLRPH